MRLSELLAELTADVPEHMRDMAVVEFDVRGLFPPADFCADDVRIAWDAKTARVIVFVEVPEFARQAVDAQVDAFVADELAASRDL